jgi:hypothetical protein
MKRDLSKPLASTFGDEPKGKTLGKTSVSAPKAKPIGQDYAAVSKAGDKNKQRQATAAAAPKPMSKAKKAAIAIGSGVAIAGKVAYDVYHDKIRRDYMGEYNVGRGTISNPPLGDNPSNRSLRKWKKSR